MKKTKFEKTEFFSCFFSPSILDCYSRENLNFFLKKKPNTNWVFFGNEKLSFFSPSNFGFFSEKRPKANLVYFISEKKSKFDEKKIKKKIVSFFSFFFSQIPVCIVKMKNSTQKAIQKLIQNKIPPKNYFGYF